MFILTEEIGSEVRRPLELLYMRRLRASLRTIDAWPYQEPGDHYKVPVFLQHKVLLPIWLSSLVSQWQYIQSNYRRLPSFEVAKSLVMAMISIVDCSRIPILWRKWYGEVMEEFVTEIHLLLHRNKSDYAMKVHMEVHNYCVIINSILQGTIIFGVPMYSLGSLVTNLYTGMLTLTGERPENVTFFYGIHYAVPFDTETWLPGYLMIYTLTAALSYWTAITLFALDIYLGVLVLHTWGHLKILSHELRTYPRPAKNNWFSQEESEEVLELVKQHIEYHKWIIGFMKKTSNAFSPMLGIYLFFHQACGCILLLQCAKMTPAALLEFGILTISLFLQLIQLSVMFEMLGTQVENVSDAVYLMPWECMGLRERKVALIFLGQAQSAAANARLKAIGLLPVGVNTMATIIKTSITYFMMLRSTAL